MDFESEVFFGPVGPVEEKIAKKMAKRKTLKGSTMAQLFLEVNGK